MRIRFFCCLMLAIGVKTPASAGSRDRSRGLSRTPSRTGPPRIVRRRDDVGADDVTTAGPGETADPGTAPSVPPPAGHGRRLALSTALFALATAVSRALGLVREVVAKNYFGVEGKVNAFQIAFLVPNT